MASRIAGSKASTSRPEGRSAAGAGARRFRVLQLMLMQGVLLVMLAALALLSRDEPRTMGLCLWTMLVPLGFAGVYGSAYARNERALRERTWSREWAAREDKRSYSLLGGVFALWILGVLGVLVLL